MRSERRHIIGRTNADLLSPDEAAYDAVDREVLRSGKMHVGEGTFRTADGERIMHTSTIAIEDHGASRYLRGISEDITERRANEARNVHLAHHDGLTDLPNRTLFHERLAEALTTRRRTGHLVAVLCIDLDRFKDVNDNLGHGAGDTLLQEVARRLRNCVRSDDMVARLGGDEFAVVQPSLASSEEARRVAACIISVLEETFRIDDQDVTAGASVGIATAPSDGESAELLLRHADMALYRAKAEGRNTTRFFESEMDARLQERRGLERDLRSAFANGRLEIYYQPLLTVGEARSTGFEALLRWNCPKRGFVPPSTFIAIAEEIGLIGPITEWVLTKACTEAMRWPSHVRIAVNLSPAQFPKQNPVRCVKRALKKSGLAPNRLELEITESVLLTDSETNIGILHDLREFGVRIAMDDFGTGYSTLSYLRTFPFDKIKIDRSFIQELSESAQCSAIVRAVTSLGASLGMTKTAEGVETVEQFEKLRLEGCDELQGFLFSQPVPAAAALEMVRALIPKTPLQVRIRPQRGRRAKA